MILVVAIAIATVVVLVVVVVVVVVIVAIAIMNGQFSEFHVCFCGLDPGNLKFETVRTNKQRICV